jgi:flagellin
MTLTAKAAGAAGSGYTIAFQEMAGIPAATPVAVMNGKAITVYVDNAANTTLANIQTALTSNAAINTALTVAVSNGAGVFTHGNAADDALTGTTANIAANDVYQSGGTDVNLTGTTAGGVDTGLAADSVFELSGASGSQTFNFKQGTTITGMAAAINLATDTTGVSATVNGTTLQLKSTGFGSNSFVNVNTVSGTQGFTLSDDVTSATRATGSDIVGTINGTQATGSGQTLSLNTAALSLSANVSAAGTYGFSVQSGGALFQLGPTVVGSQQAQIGIQSVSSGSLGGTAGRLFQLGSGQAAALATDPSKAGQILQSALDEITSLRGQLGAFQTATIDTNISTLTDAVTNLTAAQSSIQDADFAAESANLSREQILVQSGTTVAGIASSTPANVHSLLQKAAQV